MIYLPCILAFVLLFMGVPVGLSLLTSSLIYFGFMTDTLSMTGVIQKMVQGTMSSTLLTIPMFLFMGTVMNRCNITNQLMNWCNALVGHKTGGLAHVNILLSTVNGGICGSSSADSAMQCKILVPEMVKKGYPVPFAAAVTAASGLIAPMIPPGNALILYATMTETSIMHMFMAGYIPGIMMCVSEMVVATIICRKHGYQTSTGRANWRVIGKTTLQSIWAISLIFLLVIGLRGGLFTITEGAVTISALSLLMGMFIYKTIKLKDIPGMFVETFHMSGNILFMLMGSILFGYYLTWARIPQNITTAITLVITNKYAFMALAMLLMLVLGMLMDATAMLMIMTPILYPIAASYGIDILQFGIMMILNAYIGSLTPPVGTIMYICCDLTGTTMQDFTKACWPFMIALAVVILLIAFFPGFVTWLPALSYGYVPGV